MYSSSGGFTFQPSAAGSWKSVVSSRKLEAKAMEVSRHPLGVSLLAYGVLQVGFLLAKKKKCKSERVSWLLANGYRLLASDY